VYGPLYRRWIQSFFLTLFALGIVILLGRMIYRRISDPLAQMVEDAESAQPGDPSPLKAQGPREVAQGATRFNEAWGAWREAEEERLRSEQRIRSLVENAVTGIYISTRGGKFLEVNQAMVDLLGYASRDELLGTPVSALYPSVEERLEILASHGQKEVFHGVEVTWRRKDGSSVAVRLFGRGISLPDGEEGWEVIVEDVTRLRSLQEQYLQSQKMEALGRLAGGIAHDFNNLLTVVQGQAELILDDPRVGEDLKHQVREIREAADRGATLNRQLLAFARRGSDAGKIVDLNRILSDFALILRRAVGEEINLEFAPGHGLGSIRGDRGQLEQVMMNLLVNAKDAMPRGGDLLVETYNTDLGEEEAAAYPPAVPGPHVVLAVSDTGVGIGREDLPSIFEPFFSTKPESQGTGLGLATVYGIVTEMGGHIRVESEPGQGTTFRLFFPLTEGRPLDEAVTREETKEAAGSGLILLAEDEEGVRRLTTRILERAGYKVISAADGRAALDLAMTYEGTFDLLVTDVVMPEMRGPELAEALARAGKVKRAVLFSGYPEGMREAGLRGLERWELLSKPFTSKDLLAAVRRAMEAEA
jgi:PAS domain S-box-containing protein